MTDPNFTDFDLIERYMVWYVKSLSGADVGDLDQAVLNELSVRLGKEVIAYEDVAKWATSIPSATDAQRRDIEHLIRLAKTSQKFLNLKGPSKPDKKQS